MKRTHVMTIAVLLGLAAVFGLVAAVKTAHLGSSASQSRPSTSSITARERKLNLTELALRRALASRPPAVPAAPVRAPQQVIVRRPAPLVVVKHRSGANEGESEHEGADD